MLKDDDLWADHILNAGKIFTYPAKVKILVMLALASNWSK